jgi:hypothetical protein
MEEFTKITLLHAASALSRNVEALTKEFPEHTTCIRILQEKSAALPASIAASVLEINLTASANLLKQAYELAHDAEYMLLLSLFFRYVPYADASGLFDEFYKVKRLIIAELKETHA